jgi:hypothetical protein
VGGIDQRGMLWPGSLDERAGDVGAADLQADRDDFQA